MNLIFEPNQNQFRSGLEAALTALTFHLPEDNPQSGRVGAGQQLLFPSNPRAVCDELGLNWWAALKLHEDGWLSFSPEHTARLDESQEAELRFVGALVMAGCDRNVLTVLLSGLTRPYAYDLKRVFFDWRTRRWRMLPDPRAHPEAAFADWLETLVQHRDVASLTGITELAEDALARLLQQTAQAELSAPHWRETSDQEDIQG